MPSISLIDRPLNSFVSVYEPIKFSARLESTNRALYPSCLVRIIPYDLVNDVSEFDNEVQIRVQAQPKNPTNLDQDAWAVTSTLYYSGDISSICRDFVSFDLRPCNQDTTTGVRRDITQGAMMLNTQKYFTVKIHIEKINSDGQLVIDDDTDELSFNFHAINAALSNEEQHASYIDNVVNSISGGTKNFVNGGFFRRYLHYDNANRNRLSKYLTLKPTNKRYIGEDECEYLSMLLQKDSNDNYPYLQFAFYDLSGNQIGNTFFNARGIAKGDGTYSDKPHQYGISGVADETKVMVQFGVGTRNIKENNFGWFKSDGSAYDDGFNVVQDFRYISYYTVRSRFSQAGTDPIIGETVTYYINHSTTNIGTTRFHWQNRLGGIDSYTFEDTMIKSIMTSSSTFEQTIYPKFGDQLGESSDTNFYFDKANEQRTGGITSDQYHSVAKSNIKSYRNGQAVSRPISNSEIPMIEDLLSSPRVWIEGGWIGKEVWRDNFDSIPTSADWNIIDGTLGADNLITTSSDNHIAGSANLLYTTAPSTIQEGETVQSLSISSKNLFPYDPNKIYELEIRTKRSGSGDGTTYCGLTGYAADKTTKISTSGTNIFGSSHYITLDQYDQVSDDEWETHRGYITGFGVSGSAGGLGNDINNPAHAYEGIKFFAPIVILGYNDESTISQVDYIKVTEYESDLPNSERWYSTLNRNYYIPVVIKDSTTTMYDSNNMQKITVDYMHSKEQKTLK